MNEAFGSINEFKREVSDLSPQHKEASDEIKALVEEVEAQKQDYIEVIDVRAGEGEWGRELRKVSDLSPQHKEASDEIKALVEEVEAQKQVIVLNVQILFFPNL